MFAILKERQFAKFNSLGWISIFKSKNNFIFSNTISNRECSRYSCNLIDTIELVDAL